MEIPGLGPVEEEEYGGYRSEPIPVSLFENEVEFTVDGYDDDPRPEDFHAAIEAFLALDRSALDAASGLAFEYYKVYSELIDEDAVPVIAGPEEVWDHVTFGVEGVVRRDQHGDNEVCVLLMSGCDWEPEHGLQMVFRRGSVLSRVSECDGHMS